MCLTGHFRERGIRGLHGFMSERYAESPAYLVKLPPHLQPFAVLMEPMSVVQKGIEQALAHPAAPGVGAAHGGGPGRGPGRHPGRGRAAAARARGAPWPRCEPRGLVQGPACCARPGIRTSAATTTPLATLPRTLGPIDIVFEATGATAVVFPAMRILGPDGVCILSSVTGGRETIEVDLATWNREMVLGNRVVFGTVNAGRRHFEMGRPGPRGHRGARSRVAEPAHHPAPPVHRLAPRRCVRPPRRHQDRPRLRLRPVPDDPGQEPSEKVIATNRKAFFNYEIFDRAEAGMVLVGSEVKSIREGGFNFRDSFVEFRGGELFLVGCRIGPYSHGNLQNHADERDRKLLLHKREILKIGGKATEKGFTILPLKAYFKKGRVKLEIGLARGKKAHDKRESIKRKDIDRETRQAVRDATRLRVAFGQQGRPRPSSRAAGCPRRRCPLPRCRTRCRGPRTCARTAGPG